MKTLYVDLPGRDYDILIGRGLLDEAGARLRPLLKGNKIALITDSNVEPLYATRVARSLHLAGFEPFILEVPAGEQSKCPAVLAELWEEMMDLGLTRSDTVAALGGGVVGDLAGFAAATILRGVAFVQIPTTLLAQVDSSVGGKVAVDLEHGKNLAGAFYQPKLVLMDPDCLETLPESTFMEGMAEVLKYGCIFDAPFFDFLAARPSRGALMADIEDILYTCCDHKRRVVVADERDTGERMLLNFGHTLGHAYELAGNYETWSHGQAVAAGMVAAAKLGVALGLTPADVPEKIQAAEAALGLPTAISCTMDDYTAAVGLDKKGAGNDISLIVLETMGHAVAHKMPKDQVLAQLKALGL
jgi:3-dehydroquinate synthase